MPVPVVVFTPALEEELTLDLAVVHTLVPVVANTLAQAAVNMQVRVEVSMLAPVAEPMLVQEVALIPGLGAAPMPGRAGLVTMGQVGRLMTNGIVPILTVSDAR